MSPQTSNPEARRSTIIILLVVVAVGIAVELFLIFNSTTPYHSNAVNFEDRFETLSFYWDGHTEHTQYDYRDYPWLPYLFKGAYGLAAIVCIATFALVVRRWMHARKRTSAS